MGAVTFRRIGEKKCLSRDSFLAGSAEMEPLPFLSIELAATLDPLACCTGSSTGSGASCGRDDVMLPN